MFKYVCGNYLLPKCQYIFRKDCSIASALSQVSDDISAICDQRLVNVLVLLDFSNAFDKTKQDLLLYRTVNIIIVTKANKGNSVIASSETE